MNLIEFVFLLSCVVLAWAFWAIGNRVHGPFLGIAGVIAGLAMPFVVQRALLLVGNLLLEYRPLRPVCESGKCGCDDYEVVECDRREVEFMCRCGKRYLKSGNRFLKVCEDGHTEPYKVRFRGRWVDDKG